MKEALSVASGQGKQESGVVYASQGQSWFPGPLLMAAAQMAVLSGIWLQPSESDCQDSLLTVCLSARQARPDCTAGRLRERLVPEPWASKDTHG